MSAPDIWSRIKRAQRNDDIELLEELSDELVFGKITERETQEFQFLRSLTNTRNHKYLTLFAKILNDRKGLPPFLMSELFEDAVQEDKPYVANLIVKRPDFNITTPSNQKSFDMAEKQFFTMIEKYKNHGWGEVLTNLLNSQSLKAMTFNHAMDASINYQNHGALKRLVLSDHLNLQSRATLQSFRNIMDGVGMYKEAAEILRYALTGRDIGKGTLSVIFTMSFISNNPAAAMVVAEHPNFDKDFDLNNNFTNAVHYQSSLSSQNGRDWDAVRKAMKAPRITEESFNIYQDVALRIDGIAWSLPPALPTKPIFPPQDP